MPAASHLRRASARAIARETTATGVPDSSHRARADGEVQQLDVGGQLLFERERHGLREPRTATHGQFGFGQRDLAARQQQDDATFLRHAERVRHGTAVHRAGAGAVGIHDEPGRRRLFGGTEPYHQRLRHRTSKD